MQDRGDRTAFADHPRLLFRIRVQVHRPDAVFLPFCSLQHPADETQQGRGRQKNDVIIAIPGHQPADRAEIKGGVVGQPTDVRATSKATGTYAMDANSVMNLFVRHLEVARQILTSTAEHAHVKAGRDQVLRQIGQVLARRCEVGVVMLIDEKNRRLTSRHHLMQSKNGCAQFQSAPPLRRISASPTFRSILYSYIDILRLNLKPAAPSRKPRPTRYM